MSNPFRDFNTYKIDPITEIRNAGIVTAGDVYWVSSESDVSHRDRIDKMGRGVVKTSLQAGIDATSADENDYVLVVPQDSAAAWSLGTALDIAKDRVHMLSVGYTKANNGYTNQVLGAYGTTPDAEVINVTGDGVEIGGFHVKGTIGTNAGGSMTNSVLYVDGNDFWGHDLYVEMNQNAWTAPAVLNFGGTEPGARFDDCEFSVTGTGNAEAAVAGVLKLGDGGVKYAFHNCVVSATCGSTTDTLIASGTGNKEFVLFKNCDFINNDVSIAVASAIRGSTTVDSPVLCVACTVVGCAQLGTDPGVFIAPADSGTRALLYNSYIAQGTAALAAA